MRAWAGCAGRLRRTALYYGIDDDRYVLVGSNGGAKRNPAWFHNVLEHPDVEVQVRAEKFTAHARVATGSERTRLWEMMAELVPQYAGYQKRLRRELPIVVVERS